METLSISIIVFFSLSMVSLGGLVYCMIAKRYDAGGKFVIALLFSFIMLMMQCCAYIGMRSKETDCSCGCQKDTEYTCRSLSERELLILSIMSVESNFNPEAEGKHGDTGILQIRQIYVDEVNRILGCNKYTLSDAYDIDKSLEMFDILQKHHNPDNDFIKTIYYHNKSDAYQERTVKEYNRMLLYEAMREKLIKRYNNECSGKTKE